MLMGSHKQEYDILLLVTRCIAIFKYELFFSYHLYSEGAFIILAIGHNIEILKLTCLFVWSLYGRKIEFLSV